MNFKPCRRFYANGQLQDETQYLDGKWKFEQWNDTGKIRRREYYKDGKAEGMHEAWHDNGQITKCQLYRDGKREGECKCWYPNGQIRVEEFYRDDKAEGHARSWYKNGQLELSRFFLNERLEGKLKLFHPNGRPHKIESYRNGKDGEYRSWSPDGVLLYVLFSPLRGSEEWVAGTRLTPKMKLSFLRVRSSLHKSESIISTFLISDLFGC